MPTLKEVGQFVDNLRLIHQLISKTIGPLCKCVYKNNLIVKSKFLWSTIS